MSEAEKKSTTFSPLSQSDELTAEDRELILMLPIFENYDLYKNWDAIEGSEKGDAL